MFYFSIHNTHTITENKREQCVRRGVLCVPLKVCMGIGAYRVADELVCLFVWFV